MFIVNALGGALASTVVGGLLGGGAGNQNTNGGAGTTTKSPWGPAQPYLTDNLARNQTLQNYYAANPFSQQQKDAYQGLLSNLGNFNNNVAPGMMQFANNAMTGSYQRPQYGKPGTAGYGGAPRVDQTPGAMMSRGLGLGGPFTVQKNNFAPIDWNQYNPTAAQNTPATPATPVSPDLQAVIDDYKRRMAGADQQGGGSGWPGAY